MRIILLLLAFSQQAYAANPPISARIIFACTSDAISLCSEYLNDIQKSAVCMKKNYKLLSPGCLSALKEAGYK